MEMPPKRILIAEDSRVALMNALVILGGSSSYELIVARAGEDAFAKATEEAPDLILMDAVMPKMDGLQACRRLRMLESTNTIPIIMVTTRGTAANMELGYECGCDDYLTKPFTRAQLTEKIEKWIGRSAGGDD